MPPDGRQTRRWVPHVGRGTVLAVAALLVSGLSFYRSYLYTKQDLEITVTEASYVTNQGGVYLTIAFSNGGNRDAAVLRVEPALSTGGDTSKAAWKARSFEDLNVAPPGDKLHSNKKRRSVWADQHS